MLSKKSNHVIRHEKWKICTSRIVLHVYEPNEGIGRKVSNRIRTKVWGIFRFFLVFDYQSFDANEWPGKSVFPPDENRGFALLRSSSRAIKLFSTFQRGFNREMLIRKISPGFGQVLLAWIQLFSPSLEKFREIIPFEKSILSIRLAFSSSKAAPSIE